MSVLPTLCVAKHMRPLQRNVRTVCGKMRGVGKPEAFHNQAAEWRSHAVVKPPLQKPLSSMGLSGMEPAVKQEFHTKAIVGIAAQLAFFL